MTTEPLILLVCGMRYHPATLRVIMHKVRALCVLETGGLRYNDPVRFEKEIPWRQGA